MNPGDEAPRGALGTGENVCPACHGTGMVGGETCESCNGTGKVIAGIGGA
jgi:DnaJ-class molecular chaperone